MASGVTYSVPYCSSSVIPVIICISFAGDTGSLHTLVIHYVCVAHRVLVTTAAMFSGVPTLPHRYSS